MHDQCLEMYVERKERVGSNEHHQTSTVHLSLIRMHDQCLEMYDERKERVGSNEHHHTLTVHLSCDKDV